MRTENPPPVRLSDYRAYPFRIDQVRMRFQLHPTDTRVLTELSIRRTGDADAPLVLDGES
jgi:aminopeptidase N